MAVEVNKSGTNHVNLNAWMTLSSIGVSSRVTKHDRWMMVGRRACLI